MLAYKDGGRVQLISRNGRDYTRRFRNIAATIGKLSARTLVLDGEIAIFDQQLRSRFEWLREPDPDAVASPPLFMAFDLLYHDRRDVTGRPLCDRRARLEDIVAGSELVFPARGGWDRLRPRRRGRDAEAPQEVRLGQLLVGDPQVPADRLH
jgi:ATP-dependent DNA ligase